jgi:hypothetical protein
MHRRSGIEDSVTKRICGAAIRSPAYAVASLCALSENKSAKSVIVAACAFVAAIAVIYEILPPRPLSTHFLQSPPVSGSVARVAAVTGVSDLPLLLFERGEGRRKGIIGASLLQIGLASVSVLVLEQASKSEPADIDVRSTLGEALVLANDGRVTNEAKAEFDVVLSSEPNHLIGRYYTGLWLMQNGKPKQALVKWIGLMRTVGSDPLWYDKLWAVLPNAADAVGVSPLALQALCTAGM